MLERVWVKGHPLTQLVGMEIPRNYGKQYGGSLKKELQYDPAIPLLGIYLEKTIIQKDTCTLIFIVELFTITKTWKQLKCPSTEK